MYFWVPFLKAMGISKSVGVGGFLLGGDFGGEIEVGLRDFCGGLPVIFRLPSPRDSD